jgi:ribosomal protein S2
MRLYLLTQTLIENFTHVGFYKTGTNHAYRFYLTGHHLSISIINPALTALSLRKVAMILLRLLNRKHRLCFITYKLPTFLKGKSLFLNNQYCLDYWVPGTFTNRRFSRLYGSSNSRTFLRRRVPAVVLVLGLSQRKSYDVYKETRARRILCVSFLDSDAEPSVYSYFIPTNTKSLATLYFFLDLFSHILSYSHISIKKRFIKNVFKKKKF